ncbi:MAG: response regulator [Candidatus Acidiferrales bacterium]
MKRILFVDDEMKILEGLQRMLRPQRQIWEMAFAPGGQAALGMLDAAPFDVIISDMRMPGMDGATLLKTVREKYPSVLRIILSGYSDMEAAFNAVPVAHQFLLKPCDQDTLRNAIDRATSLSDVLNSKMLANLVGSIQQLPSLPQMCLELQQTLADPDSSSRQVAQIVERDTAMSAKILQLVNSAFFGFVRNVSDIQTAINYLGISTLQNLVLSAEVFRVFHPAQSIPGFSLEAHQSHSQLTARIAKGLSGNVAMASAVPIAGLLHDVGKLVLAEAMPGHLAAALKRASEERRPLYEIEEEMTGISHAEVGAYLLSMWGLPYVIIEAVAHHHHPERVPHDKLDVLACIYFANWLANDHEARNSDTVCVPNPPPNPDIVAKLDVEEKLPEWLASADAAALELAGVCDDKR